MLLGKEEILLNEGDKFVECRLCRLVIGIGYPVHDWCFLPKHRQIIIVHTSQGSGLGDNLVLSSLTFPFYIFCKHDDLVAAKYALVEILPRIVVPALVIVGILQHDIAREVGIW